MSGNSTNPKSCLTSDSVSLHDLQYTSRFRTSPDATNADILLILLSTDLSLYIIMEIYTYIFYLNRFLDI